MGSSADVSLRRAALVAGVALLAMGFLTPFAEFFVFPKLIVPGDIEETVLRIRAHPALFLAGAFANLTTFSLDVVVAWALFELLAPIDRSLSLLTAWFRLIYTAIALFGPLKLLTAYRLLDTSEYGQIELLLESSRTEWGLSLMLFGVHLVLLGYLVHRSNFIPGILGLLLAIAGLGYILFNLGPYLYPSVDVSWLSIAFFGEVVFIFWLLIRGGRIAESTAGARNAA